MIKEDDCMDYLWKGDWSNKIVLELCNDWISDLYTMLKVWVSPQKKKKTRRGLSPTYISQKLPLCEREGWDTCRIMISSKISLETVRAQTMNTGVSHTISGETSLDVRSPQVAFVGQRQLEGNGCWACFFSKTVSLTNKTKAWVIHVQRKVKWWHAINTKVQETDTAIRNESILEGGAKERNQPIMSHYTSF